MTDMILASAPAIINDWQFSPSAPSIKDRLLRMSFGAMRRRNGPDWECLSAIRPAGRWIGYFIFSPDGQLADYHRFTLDRLQSHDALIAIVFASPSVALVPPELSELSDALYWKDTGGFDFSAYAIIASEVAKRAPGTDLIMMNDSVYGPFQDLYSVFDRGPWGMTGLTGFSLIENHIQSYAVRFRSFDGRHAACMNRVAGPTLAFNRFADVVYCQETRFARQMAEITDVGALWFSDHRAGGGDLPLTRPLGLIEEGFPFIKKSLFTKFLSLSDPVQLRSFLKAQYHPVP